MTIILDILLTLAYKDWFCHTAQRVNSATAMFFRILKKQLCREFKTNF